MDRNVARENSPMLNFKDSSESFQLLQVGRPVMDTIYTRPQG
jgi:hypothetical protein